MYKSLLGIGILAFSLIFSQTIFADSGDCRKGIQTFVDNLSLDQAQKDKIKPILEQLKATVKDAGAQIMALNKQIHQQIQSTTMDQSAVNGLIDQKVKLVGDIIKAKVSAKNQIYMVLTPQQRTKLQDRMNKMEEKIAEKYKACHDQE